MKENHKIECDVTNCCYNADGRACKKNCICVKSDMHGGTCCCSFEDKEED